MNFEGQVYGSELTLGTYEGSDAERDTVVFSLPGEDSLGLN